MNRWWRLVAAVVAMIMIANLQYSWTLFVKPIIAATGWKLSEVQWGFTFFIALETWAMPFSGWLIDRIGPRIFITLGGLLCGFGWASLGLAHTVPELYAAYAVAGIGAALIYCGSLAIALKWFPDKRGLATGIIVAAFGSGAALFIPAIAYLIRVHNYATAFLYTGVLQGVAIVCAAQFMQNPGPDFVPPQTAAKIRIGAIRTLRPRQTQEFTSLEMLRTPHFYLLYVMMLMMGIGGLMVTAQVGPVANSLKVSASILTLALTVSPIANGAGRVFWGWVSDHAGRERTMIVAFTLQSLSLISVILIGRASQAGFVVCLALVFFTWGEIYALFPPASAEFFGTANSSSNYGLLYSSKGVASILGGGLAALLYEKTGTWSTAFYGSAVLALCAALLGFALRAIPLPRKQTQMPSDATVEHI